MTEDLIFRLLFFSVFVAFLGIRAYYGQKATPPGRKRSRKERWADATKYERGLFVFLRVFVIYVLLIFIVVYTFVPHWVIWTQLPIPSIIRWIGVVLSIITTPFIVWVGRTLGKHVSGQLELRAQHQLITTGPYSRVRHPMYTVYLIFNLGMLLAAANWLLILIILAGVLVLYPRMLAEENMLLDEFGEEYRAYMQQTGRLIPKLRRTPVSTESDR